MTEEIASTPGWVEQRLDTLFDALPPSPELHAARTAYLTCLAQRKSPAAPSDILGSEFETCRPALHRSLMAAGVEPGVWTTLATELETLEAEIAGNS